MLQPELGLRTRPSHPALLECRVSFLSRPSATSHGARRDILWMGDRCVSLLTLLPVPPGLSLITALPLLVTTVSGPVLLLGLFRKFARGTIPVLTWGGLRGGISVALALALPEVAEKSALLAATYALVLFTLIYLGSGPGPSTSPSISHRNSGRTNLDQCAAHRSTRLCSIAIGVGRKATTLGFRINVYYLQVPNPPCAVNTPAQIGRRPYSRRTQAEKGKHPMSIGASTMEWDALFGGYDAKP